jgi:hypothetical protein
MELSEVRPQDSAPPETSQGNVSRQRAIAAVRASLTYSADFARRYDERAVTNHIAAQKFPNN